IGTKYKGGLVLDGRLEPQFGTRKYADSHRTILRRGKSSCAGAKVMCDEFFAHFGWACSHSVQTIVAHIRTSSLRSPPWLQCQQRRPRDASRAIGVVSQWLCTPAFGDYRLAKPQ